MRDDDGVAGRRRTNLRGAGLRHALAVAGVVLLGGVLVHPSAVAREGCGSGQFDKDHPPGACWRPFSNESPFNRLVSPAPRQLANSRELAAAVAAGSARGPRFYGGIADTADDYSHPLYFSGPNDPVFKVNCLEFGGQCEVDGLRVRIPDHAMPAGGDDAHLAVIDQDGDWEYDFWQVRSKPAGGGRLNVSWGGRTRVDSENARGLEAGGTAADFALSAGVIRPAELRAGKIDHALFMTVVCTNGRRVYPSGDGVGTRCGRGTVAPPMGAHFYLAMSKAEIDALAIADWQRTILHAMRRYGMYVGDTGGDGWGIKLESGTSRTSFGAPDPWATLGRRFGVPTEEVDGTTRYVFDLGTPVDWGRELRVAAPCLARASC